MSTPSRTAKGAERQSAPRPEKQPYSTEVESYGTGTIRTPRTGLPKEKDAERLVPTDADKVEGVLSFDGIGKTQRRV